VVIVIKESTDHTNQLNQSVYSIKLLDVFFVASQSVKKILDSVPEMKFF